MKTGIYAAPAVKGLRAKGQMRSLETTSLSTYCCCHLKWSRL